MIQVAIPTYRRAQTLKAKALTALKIASVLPECIDIWCSDPEEIAEYRRTLEPGSYGRLLAGEVGMAANRNAIHKGYPKGTRLLCVDDDVAKISRLGSDGKLTPVTDLLHRAEYLFRTADEVGARLWGVYPVHNHFFMKHMTRTDLRFIVGSLYGITLHKETCELVTQDEKEDFERTFLCYLADGALVRCESIAPLKRYYVEPGGMQVKRTRESMERGARALEERFHELCTYRVSRAGRPELTLKDRRAQVSR